jgi:sulfatase maturation enzyme AslB (radical SAM superfamily)
MCDATRSSEWAKDIGQPVSTVTTAMIDDLAEISDHVQRICIQGGEPTIMPEFEYYFSLLDQKGLTKNIELMMITNATNVNKRFYELLEKFKKVRLTVSVDAYQSANDYIRWPSNFTQIEKNLLKMSELPANIEVEIFNTINILSMFNYYEFLNWCKKIENIFDAKGKVFKIVPMKVEGPKKYSPFCAPRNLKDKFIEDIRSFMDENNLIHNTNWKTEMMVIMKRINSTPADNEALDLLKDAVKKLDQQRNVKINNYIPDFNKYIND